MFASYDEVNRRLNINFSGEIDHHTCLEIAKKTDDVIRKYLPQKVIFDFENVSFMDSSGIGMLLGVIVEDINNLFVLEEMLKWRI